MKILVTGASGFVGRNLITYLKFHTNNEVITFGRTRVDGSDSHISGDLTDGIDFSSILLGVDVVIHCAGRAHVMNDCSSDALSSYRIVNTEPTVKLAKFAAKAGVGRFIYLSSIKVNGESTTGRAPFSSIDQHLPTDDYGISKSEAELGLIDVANHTNLDYVIIRPTLIYGEGVKANFESLMSLVNKRVPLPFGCINENRRSIVSIRNVVELITICLDHPKAANEIFLISDDDDLSTKMLVQKMSIALEKPSFQIPVPVWVYKLIGEVCNRKALIERLIGSLQVDITHTKKTLDWSPSQSVDDGFRDVAHYIKSRKS